MYSKEYENFLIPKTLLQNEFLDNMRSSTLHAFNFKITNVKPGDEVELVYSYKTLTENNRVFFHSLLPKQNLSLSVSYATNEVYFFDFFNNAQPTLMPKADNESKERTYVWEMKNLPAYKNEVNSRPHTNLPYFTYYYHYRDFGKLKSNGDYEQFLPYIWEAYYRRYVNYVEKGFKIDYSRNEQLSKRFFNRPDKNTMTLNRFFESRTANIPDTFLIKRFMSIHNHITDSFNYDNDKEWFKEGFMKVKNISKVIDDKTLHNVSRTRLYYEMASRLRDDFYITMLADKRIENTDLNKYKPMIRWKYFYVIPYQGSYFFFYPKLDRFGHYANEMPFYNENNITFLIPQAIPDSSTWHEHTIISFPRTATPYSSIADNVRTSQILVNVNTQRNQADFATRVELKGQYSTLTRGFYQYESKDPLVSENYYHKIWEIPGCVKPDSVNVTENSKDFPFAYHFTAYYQTDKLLTKNQDGSFSIHLKDLLRFITEKNLDTTKRITDFYPDFIGQDTYKYYFKFDHAITVSNAEEINFEEKNSFGALRIQVMNAQPNVILLESKLVVNAERVAATSITEVAWLCNVLDKLDQRSLVIK